MSDSLNPALVREYQKYVELDAQAHALWEKVDKQLSKVIRIGKVGRRARAVLPISESRGIEIKNQFRGELKVFAPAFARKWKVKEVALSE